MKFLLTMAIFAAGVFSAPANLTKRAEPKIIGFTQQERKQMLDAHKDAIELANYAATSKSSVYDPIYRKYFAQKDYQTVWNVFKRIINDDPKSESGHPLIGDITIVKDYKDPDDGFACPDGTTFASLNDYNTAKPRLVICPLAFNFGGISKGYPGVKEINCDYLDDRTSWRMQTLGAVFLHEYTHFDDLMSLGGGPLKKGTIDVDKVGYGAYNTRHLSGEQAVKNADSFVWLATELLWTTICHKQYADPTELDSQDPYTP